jgi:hypothetical protein
MRGSSWGAFAKFRARYKYCARGVLGGFVCFTPFYCSCCRLINLCRVSRFPLLNARVIERVFSEFLVYILQMK